MGSVPRAARPASVVCACGSGAIDLAEDLAAEEEADVRDETGAGDSYVEWGTPGSCLEDEGRGDGVDCNARLAAGVPC